MPHFDITGDPAKAFAALRATEAGVARLNDKPITIEGNQMFERFTDRARRVVVLAQEEARTLNHNYIGTEHILLGLIHEGEGVAAKALTELGIALEGVRAGVQEIIGEGQEAPTGHIPFTPRGKRVMELALREALHLGHNYIGTEHLLLALIREGEGVGAQVLTKLGAELNRVRQQVLQLLAGYSGSTEAGAAVAAVDVSAATTLPSHSGNVCPKCPSTDVNTDYRAEISYSKSTSHVHDFREYLHRECRTCGYTWREACRT